NFCVGEAVSIPILRASARAAVQPLIRAVLWRIVKDEAAHGRFGWLYLDWIGGQLDDGERAHLRAAAADEIDKIERTWAANFAGDDEPAGAPTLGWMERATYLRVALDAMEHAVKRPLAARGLAVAAAVE